MVATTLGGRGSLSSHGCAVHLWGLGGKAGSSVELEAPWRTSTEAVRTWGFGALISRVHQTLSCLRPVNGGAHHQPVSPAHPQAWLPPVRLSCVCWYAPQHTTPSLQAAAPGPSPGPLVPPNPLTTEAVLGPVRKLRPQPLHGVGPGSDSCPSS